MEWLHWRARSDRHSGSCPRGLRRITNGEDNIPVGLHGMDDICFGIKRDFRAIGSKQTFEVWVK